MMAARLERPAKVVMVVDLTIERDDDLPIGASHRLRTAFGKVEYG
jgi:hypothetical protein